MRTLGTLDTVGDTTAADELRAQYSGYRRRQARGLIRLLPKEVIRPLYRRAMLASTPGAHSINDPLGVLVAYCEDLLPLPPFEVWVHDMTLHPVAHLHDLDDSAEAPTARAPVTTEARLFDYEEDPWVAYLRSYRDGGTWRGYIAFEQRRSGRVHRTSVIFRENDPAELRERFLNFESTALEAFLRSALP